MFVAQCNILGTSNVIKLLFYYFIPLLNYFFYYSPMNMFYTANIQSILKILYFLHSFILTACSL